MESDCDLYSELSCHHTVGIAVELCDGAIVPQAGSNIRWTVERDVWKRSRADRKSVFARRHRRCSQRKQVSVVALKNGQIRIVQSSMLGSILSNILLVLGCCFLAGGLKHREQHFNTTVASTMSSLMAVSSASLIIPATLYAAMRSSDTASDKASTTKNILLLSRGTAIILLILYVLYLVFQLKTHAHLFDEKPTPEGNEEQAAEGEEANNNMEEEPLLSPWSAGVALVVVTLLVAVCAEYLVDSIDSIVQTAHISKTFIGLVLLPIVGNAAEHVTAVVVAWRDKMDLAIGVAIGSSMQIALLVTPFLVILGWIIGQEMTLRFETFETVVFFLSMLITNYLIQVCGYTVS